jgi:hypothetical protein
LGILDPGQVCAAHLRLGAAVEEAIMFLEESLMALEEINYGIVDLGHVEILV